MRIISGHAKGRKLLTPGNSKQIRPTSDRAREALFSIIGKRIHSARVLDLYAGTGALGIEALSRGASQTVFVDKHKIALDLIQRNCALCLKESTELQAQRAIIIRHDISRGLALRVERLPLTEPFDIIFLDPPYGKGLATETLKDLSDSPFLHSETLIIAEDGSSEPLPATFSRFSLQDSRRYGEAGFWFYSLNPS